VGPRFQHRINTHPIRHGLQNPIIILGEAVKRLSFEFRQSHPSVPWDEIAGMRDRCIHGYDNVDLDIVWDVASHHAPQVIAYLERIVPKSPPET